MKVLKKKTINVIRTTDQNDYISHSDAEMDARAKQVLGLLFKDGIINN